MNDWMVGVACPGGGIVGIIDQSSIDRYRRDVRAGIRRPVDLWSSPLATETEFEMVPGPRRWSDVGVVVHRADLHLVIREHALKGDGAGIRYGIGIPVQQHC